VTKRRIHLTRDDIALILGIMGNVDIGAMSEDYREDSGKPPPPEGGGF
jgi:hypothetical protein